MALSNRTVTNQASGYNSSNTISHTPAGTPSVAYAIVTFAEGGVLGSAPTYAGATMTLVGQATGSTPRNDVSVWRKTSPASGTQNCVVPANAGSYSYATVVTYEGSDTSTPESGLVTNNTTGGQSVGISSATGDEVLFGFSTHFGGATIGGSGSGLADAYGWGGTVEQHLAGYVPGAATSTVVITAGSEETSFVAFNVKAAGGGGSPALDDSDGFMLTTIQMPLTAVRLY